MTKWMGCVAEIVAGMGLAMARHMPRNLFSFRPPFCPNPQCNYHRDPRGWRPIPWGSYTRKRAPRSVPRYRCTHCKRTFGSQTFTTTYWLKRPDLLRPVFDGIANSVAFRQLARIHDVAPSTIQRLAERLGRHALLFLALHGPDETPSEPLVVDGFESFAFSQYHPLHINLAVGADSHYVYAFNESELRRKGRMTDAQKKRREQLEERDGRPDPKAIETSVQDLVDQIAPAGGSLRILSDEHRAYPRAFTRATAEVVHAKTSSKAARTPGNPLFPVNRADLLARHQAANHKRETIAFSKRLGGVVERFAVLAVWLNYQKSCSEQKRDATPAQRLGLTDHKWKTLELLNRRLFQSLVGLPRRWQLAYDRRIKTRAMRKSPIHSLRYAY